MEAGSGIEPLCAALQAGTPLEKPMRYDHQTFGQRPFPALLDDACWLCPPSLPGCRFTLNGRFPGNERPVSRKVNGANRPKAAGQIVGQRSFNAIQPAAA